MTKIWILRSLAMTRHPPLAPSARDGTFGLPRLAVGKSRNDGVDSPSLAEGARGWVSLREFAQTDLWQSIFVLIVLEVLWWLLGFWRH